MPWHLSHLLVRCRVPDVHNLVVSSHDKGLPVGYVRERPDDATCVRVRGPHAGLQPRFGDPRFTTAGRGRAQGTARTSGAELHNIERLQHVRRRIAELDHEADAVEDSFTAAEDCLARDRRGVLGGEIHSEAACLRYRGITLRLGTQRPHRLETLNVSQERMAVCVVARRALTRPQQPNVAQAQPLRPHGDLAVENRPASRFLPVGGDEIDRVPGLGRNRQDAAPGTARPPDAPRRSAGAEPSPTITSRVAPAGKGWLPKTWTSQDTGSLRRRNGTSGGSKTTWADPRNSTSIAAGRT